MIDSDWVRCGLRMFGVLFLMAVCGYGWFGVDWYDYFPAEPPDELGNIPTDSHSEVLEVLVNTDDAMNDHPHVGAGDSFQMKGRLKLDPQYWAIPLTQGQSISLPKEQLERIRIENQKKVRPVVSIDVVCKSWLNPGDKVVNSLLGTVDRVNKEEIAWKTSGTLLRPGVYLVRLRISEQDSAPRKMNDPIPESMNKRLVQRFLLEVNPYNPNKIQE